MAIRLKKDPRLALGLLSLAELLRLNSAAQNQFGQADSQAKMVWPGPVTLAAEGTGDPKPAESQMSVLIKDRSAAAGHHFLTKNISLKQLLLREQFQLN